MLPKVSNRYTNTFAGIRSAWYCRPLAILLPLLLLGDFPQFPQLGLIPRAAALSLCTNPNLIMQVCDVPASLEANALAEFLQKHSIPASEANLLYQYGRIDARSELRAYIYDYLLGIIKKGSVRTNDETAAYNWMQSKVWSHQIEQYTAAVADRDFWKSSPCHWKSDPDVAQVYNLTWDGSLWCNVGDNLGAVFAGGSYAAYPTKDYFLTAALKHTYGNQIASNVGWGDVLARMERDLGAAYGVAVGTGLGIAGVVLGPALTYIALQVGATVTSDTALAILGSGAISGPIGIAVLGAMVGAIAAFQLYNQQTALKDLATLDFDLQSNKNTKPHLESYIEDPVGRYKIKLTFVENTLPDFPSATVAPGRRPGDRNFVITPQGGAAVNSPTFTYTDWANTKWTASPSGGWISAQGVKTDNSTDYNFGLSIHFVDWNGTKYTASRNGLQFILNKLVPATGDKACEADSTAAPGDVSKCWTRTTDTLQLLDASGNKVSVKFSSDPAFTSRTSFTLPRTGGQIDITADGNPLPAISLVSSLPAGFHFSSQTPGSAQISHTGSVANGSYTFTLQASNGAISVTQTVTVLIAEAVKILGTSNTSTYGNAIAYKVALGQPYNIVVAIGGSPTPALTCASQLGALTFTDNGDGTGTFKGVYGALTRSGYDQGNYLPSWCDLIANNTVSSDRATILFYPELGPPATLTSPTTPTFADNAEYQLAVTASGTPKISFSFPCPSSSPYAQPYWLKLKDNGDGTAVLSGRPPFVGSSWQFALFASVGETPVCGPPNFTINVQHIPTLPDLMSYTLTAGVLVNVTTLGTPSGGNGSVVGTPPAGLQFTAGSPSTWMLSGTPAIGSGGEYDLLYTATKPDASVSGIFKLYVLEAPQFIIQNSAIFQIGLDNHFSVNTAGFPKSTTVPAASSATVGPMRISIQGNLPPGVTFTDANLFGVPTGTGILSGKPAAGVKGLYPLTFTADNGVGSKPIQNFTLQVIQPGDANDDGVVNCADVNIVGAAYGLYRGNAKYDARADLSSDGLVNSADLAIVQQNMSGGLSCLFTPPTIVDVSNRVSVSQSGFARNRATGLWAATMTLTNTSSTTINGPIQVVLMNLTPGVTMQNQTGYTQLVESTGTQNGSPYITALPTGTLAPGGSVSVLIQFQNPANGFITFTPGTVSGVF